MTFGKTSVLFLSPLILATSAAAETTAAGGAHEGVAPAAEALFKIGPLPVTNSMVTSWVVALVLIVAVKLAIGRRPKLVPSRAQAVVENLVQGVLDLISPIVGNRVAKKTLPLLAALFAFILIQNWSGLFPGVGTVFFSGREIIRPGGADMNMTIALAIVANVAWLYFILRYAGVKAIVYDWFGNKADRREIPLPIYVFLGVIFFLVGFIEIISILFRPVSLSFRLFGNIFGGENLLHAMSAISRWGLPIPFYFLEVLIGFVQALVFTLLVAIYIGLLCNHEGGEHGEAREAH
jgi:F-type H+-transporting ATPase subunit a